MASEKRELPKDFKRMKPDEIIAMIDEALAEYERFTYEQANRV